MKRGALGRYSWRSPFSLRSSRRTYRGLWYGRAVPFSEGQIAEVKALLENATAQLESIKTDLSEKVHSENVKCYRNIQDLFNEFDSKIEKMDEMEQGVGSVKGYVKCLSWFAILNFVVLIGFILYSLGVFNF